MSHGKLLLCCRGLTSTLRTIEELAEDDDFNHEQEEKMAEVADKANKKIVAIATDS